MSIHSQFHITKSLLVLFSDSSRLVCYTSSPRAFVFVSPKRRKIKHLHIVLWWGIEKTFVYNLLSVSVFFHNVGRHLFHFCLLLGWYYKSKRYRNAKLTLDWLSIINSVFANIFPHPPTSLPQRRSSAAEQFGLSPKLWLALQIFPSSDKS